MDDKILVGTIAAVSALSGIIISQAGTLLHSFLDRNHKSKCLRREMLEELADYVQQTVSWCENIVSNIASKEPSHAQYATTLQPVALSTEARRVYVLSLIYFPTLRAEAHILLNTCNNIYAISISKAKINVDEFTSQTKKFRTSVDNFDKLIPKVAKEII